MREIKFKAWNGERLVGPFSFENNNMWELHELSDDERATLMQYTGLKDRDGTEIYEGDVLGWWGQASWPIKYFEQLGRWGFYYLEDPETPQFWVSPKEIVKKQVIGNIYEHPHLLDKEREIKLFPIHDNIHYCRYKIPGLPNSRCLCTCTCFATPLPTTHYPRKDMRTREEIESRTKVVTERVEINGSQKTYTVTSRCTTDQLILEVLLDIRDLLTQEEKV